MIDFFLENGKINIALTKDNDSATGTSNNDAYQAIRTQINDISQKMNAIYEAMGDSSLSDEQKEAKQKEGARLEEEYDKVIKEGVQKNITNPVGVFLFKQTFYNNSTEENAALLEQIPANFQNDETIVKVKEQTEKQKKTAVGTKFIDFEMQTPEGKTVKLSDYAGKGKVVLVDFWASWCGPCRREMPNLVEAYAQYKGKNFEIVGVSLDQDAAAWKESIKKLNMTWPQMSDLKFWQSEGAQLYAVNSIPQAVGRMYAQRLGRKYGELNLIMVHLGGGISIGLHKRGVIADIMTDEEGTFSPERAGGLPSIGWARVCCSGEYTFEELSAMVRGKGGLTAYLGTNDVREVEAKVRAGDKKAALIYEAMIYQTAKCIGGLAAAADGEIDGVVLTGGIANSELLVEKLRRKVRFIAPVAVIPVQSFSSCFG